MVSIPRRPGGPLARRPLHLIWIADCSGSMGIDGKIQALNYAIRDAVPHMRGVAADNPNAEVLLRAVRFSSGAAWHVPQPTPVAEFQWSDLAAGGVTDMGHALALVAEVLHVPPMSARALPPVLVLLSYGAPTDDFEGGLHALMSEPWGANAVRIAVAIGADADTTVLQRFIGDPNSRPLRADNPEALVAQIRWVSTAVVRSASAPSVPSTTPTGLPPTVVAQPGAPTPSAAPGPRVW